MAVEQSSTWVPAPKDLSEAELIDHPLDQKKLTFALGVVSSSTRAVTFRCLGTGRLPHWYLCLSPD